MRSAGIKDLAYGYVVDADWVGHDPDAFWPTPAPSSRSSNRQPLLRQRQPQPGGRRPVGRLLGDLLVLRASAWSHGGRGERLQFPVDQYSHVGGANHFDLLNHPAVYEQIRRWLSAGEPRLPAQV